MRIKWNPDTKQFEAEFQDFNGDLASVKSAGFKTSGPPEWKWHTDKVKALDKLRKNRPASGLTILTDALAEYNRLKQLEENKKKILEELKEAKKAQSDKEIESKTKETDFEGFKCIKVEPKEMPVISRYVPPVWTGPNCYVCNGPVYFYEKQEPPTCLWCEMKVDNVPDMF